MQLRKTFRSAVNGPEIEEIRRRDWKIACPLIRLVRRPHSGEVICEGSGDIWIDSGGKIQFKIICVVPESNREALDPWNTPAGVIIPDDQYFDLLIRDVFGRAWSAERILPDNTVFGPDGDVITGAVDSVQHVENLPITASGWNVKWWTLRGFQFPENELTKTRTSVARGKRQPNSGSRNVWSFRCLGLNFLLTPDNAGVLVESWEPQCSPEEFLSVRILETLQFVLGEPIGWVVQQERRGEVIVTTVTRTDGLSGRGKVSSPIGKRAIWEKGKVTTNYHRKLFERYLRHVRTSPDRQHHLWGLINTITQVSSAYIDVQALTVTVAVEALLKREFSALGAPTPRLKSAIESAQQHICAWRGDSAVEDRLPGLSGMLSQVRPQDILEALARKKAINPQYIKAWKRLRNMNAHDFQSGKMRMEEFTSLLSQMTVLLYQIIFASIGYRGLYIDYATPGWPKRRYPDELGPA